MNRLSGDAFSIEAAGHPVGAVLGAGENQCLGNGQLFHQVSQQIGLVFLVHQVNPLFNQFHRPRNGGNVDFHRVAQHFLGQPGDFAGHGGGKQQRLPLGGQLGGDAAHIWDKPHIQHSIGLVQHKHIRLLQRNKALAHQVQQPARRGDQHVRPRLQLAGLGVLRDAAKNHAAFQRQVFAIGAEIFVNLQGQLSGGGENQGVQAVRSIPSAMQPVQDGQGEGGCFASARLSATQQIPAFDHRREGLLLNRRGLRVSHIRHGRQNLWS